MVENRMSPWEIGAFGLAIVGALNWGLWGLARKDAVAGALGGDTSVPSRITYSLVGVAGALGLVSLVRRLRSQGQLVRFQPSHRAQRRAAAAVSR